MNHYALGAVPVACINGVPLHSSDEVLSADELRQRACTELLRQATQHNNMLSDDDMPIKDGAISEAATSAIETLLDKILEVPEPSEEACQRYYKTHESCFGSGEKVHARHILFAVTLGVDVVLLRKCAEAALLDVRCHDDKDADLFSQTASALSNCPSSEQGGDLGWLTADDCAPELSKKLFGHAEVGVLPRLVHSRFGLHIVEVLQREPGVVQPFESVRQTVAKSLRRQTYVTALRQYLHLLAGHASIAGVELETVGAALLQ